LILIERRGNVGYQIGVEAGAADVANGPLSRLRLLLAVYYGDVGDMDLDKVVLAGLSLQLAESVDEGGALNVADSAT